MHQDKGGSPPPPSLRPCLKKFHRQFFSLETSGQRPETDSKEADGLATDVLRAVELLAVKWP